MQLVQLEAVVDAEGVLRLSVPLGLAQAGTRVIVTLESAGEQRCEQVGAPELDDGDLYGSCADLGLEEPPDAYIEHRRGIAKALPQPPTENAG